MQTDFGPNWSRNSRFFSEIPAFDGFEATGLIAERSVVVSEFVAEAPLEPKSIDRPRCYLFAEAKQVPDTVDARWSVAAGGNLGSDAGSIRHARATRQIRSAIRNSTAGQTENVAD